MTEAPQKIVVYPSSFDPLLNGQLDIALRAARFADEVVMAINDPYGREVLCPAQCRKEMVEESVAGVPNIRVGIFSSQTRARYTQSIGSRIMIRCLRTVEDFEKEKSDFYTNMRSCPDVDTWYTFPVDDDFLEISARNIKEIIKSGGVREDIEGTVPEPVCRKLLELHSREPGPKLVIPERRNLRLPQSFAVYAGSFDPFTIGHYDMTEQASRSFDRVQVAIGKNPGKVPDFSIEERIEMIKESTAHLPNVEVAAFSGFLVDYTRVIGATHMVRGLRNIKDFTEEQEQFYLNQEIGLSRGIDVDVWYTFPRKHRYLRVSSTNIKTFMKSGLGEEIAKLYVPQPVYPRLIAKYRKFS